MSTAIALAQQPTQLRQYSDRLLQTTAWSLKSLMPTTDQISQGSGLRSNFGHIIPASQVLPAIETFVERTSASLRIKPTVLVTALIYVERLRSRLPKSATGTADTPYRIFLSALLVADKFWSDHAVTVKRMVDATGGLFQRREICAMERALLRFLGFNMYVSVEEIRNHAEKLGINIDN